MHSARNKNNECKEKRRGVVYAVYDGANHVSVFPIGGSLEDWYNAGPSSAWTAAVKAVVVKGDGTNLYE